MLATIICILLLFYKGKNEQPKMLYLIIICVLSMALVQVFVNKSENRKLNAQNENNIKLINENKAFNKNIETLKIESNKRLDCIIKNMDYQQVKDANNPNLQRGGMVKIEAHIQNGMILDVGRKEELNKNRISLEVKEQRYLVFTLRDKYGEKYQIQSEFDTSKPHKIECLWSMQYQYMAIRVDGEVKSKVTIPSLFIFQDFSDKYEILAGSSFEGVNGNLTIFTIGLFEERI